MGVKIGFIFLVSLPMAAILGGAIQGGSLNYRKVFGKNSTPACIAAFILSVILLSVVF